MCTHACLVHTHVLEHTCLAQVCTITHALEFHRVYMHACLVYEHHRSKHRHMMHKDVGTHVHLKPYTHRALTAGKHIPRSYLDPQSVYMEHIYTLKLHP